MIRQVLCSISALVIFLQLYGQPVAVENFTAAPQTLHDYAGGTGWFAPWSSQNTVATDGYRILDTNPMVHPEFPGPGSYLQGGLANTTSGRYFSAEAFAAFQDAEDRIAVGVLYFSFLVRKLQDNDFPIEIVLADNPGQPWGVNEELISIGYFGASSNSGGDRFWSLAAFNETAIDLSDTVVTIGETYQIIVEIDFDAATTINMWVNPEDGIPDLSTPDASVSSTENLGFYNLVLRFGQVGADHGSFDEFIFSSNLDIVLPVEYVNLFAENRSDKVVINWSTATEINNDFFAVQRSANGDHWQTIGKVDGFGDSNTTQDYGFTDYQPYRGTSFYRLAQFDFDGTVNYSKMVRVENATQGLFEVALFLNDGTISLKSSSSIREVFVYNLLGQRVLHQNFGANILNASLAPIPDGFYQVLVITNQGIWKRKLLLK